MPLAQPLLENLHYDVVIIGAGASGLMCAITAAQRGRSVLVLDHANKIGKKILISGGGRCNFTNMYIEPSCYLSQNPHFCKSALARYTQWDFQALVNKYLVPWHEKKLGQLFCDDQSSDIVNVLVKECRLAGAAICLKTTVNKVQHSNNSFQLKTSLGKVVAQSLVVATGGLSFPTMGATGFGYELAEQFGHTLLPRLPALVPFTMNKTWMAHFIELSGVSAEVITRCGKQQFKEHILFTHKGLSGPAILQISSYWRQGQSIEINWLPNVNGEQWLQTLKANRSKAAFKTALMEHLTRSLAIALCEWDTLKPLTDSGNKPIQQFTPQQWQQLMQQLQHFVIQPAGTEGYKKAEVTLGGVNTNEVSSKTFESKKQAGLYFIGEVLDVTGHLGGFNFQWAWASGYCAGEVV